MDDRLSESSPQQTLGLKKVTRIARAFDDHQVEAATAKPLLSSFSDSHKVRFNMCM